MHYYSAHGLILRSEFELPELPVVDCEDAEADVTIHSNDVEPVPESAGDTSGRRIQAEPGRCRLTYASIGSFLIESGKRVQVEPVSPDVTEKKIFRRLLEDEIMSVLLHQRGLLVFHASAVAVGGKAAVFLGPQGAGKSTTAAAFHKQGYSVLGDDVIGIRFDNGIPTVMPGVPQLRLSADAVNALGMKNTTQPDSDWEPEKHYQQIDTDPMPAPLCGCYVLQDSEQLTLDKLHGRRQFVQLVAHTYTQGLLSDTEATTSHFEQCSTVVRTAPLRLLKRPKKHGELPRLVKLVARDMEKNNSVA